ncbi:hypothetical protein GORBP_052_00020 [Gordonia rubripertincta NBRC 101908]|uniref:Uncharacterized protein n=1 Tax=Gordonia rubripertincta NBRC 101908 TaxID=1077975 RepID=A0ABQ0HRV1_GORRU|nr:hypothetical protein GORBP_052_00020 [Gordonia rubripertincta NBRC 101908]
MPIDSDDRSNVPDATSPIEDLTTIRVAEFDITSPPLQELEPLVVTAKPVSVSDVDTTVRLGGVLHDMYRSGVDVRPTTLPSDRSPVDTRPLSRFHTTAALTTTSDRTRTPSTAN